MNPPSKYDVEIETKSLEKKAEEKLVSEMEKIVGKIVEEKLTATNAAISTNSTASTSLNSTAGHQDTTNKSVVVTSGADAITTFSDTDVNSTNFTFSDSLCSAYSSM